ncbi:hypothetical protein [Enterobacter sp.]|uniref:hypothetical protein n=1 Tax=Enterobacter sp. TaxID=42895 RepID=UPI00296E65F9|nr:hypothetical protein [Enterobacter sp.]
MHKLIKLTCVVSVILITGCASSGYLVQYDSTPQSAMVICNGTQKGYTPLDLYYPKTIIDGSGDLYTQACQAVWTSGATENYRQHIDTTSFPNGIKLTLERPNTDGYATDASADYQKKMNDEQIRQQNLQSFNQSMRAMQPKQTYCNQIGTQVFCNTY